MRFVKKYLYIKLFIVLGLLLSVIAHALIEMPVLLFITGDLESQISRAIWSNWVSIHRYGGGIILFFGLIFGLVAGMRYWRIVYVEKRYGEPRF